MCFKFDTSPKNNLNFNPMKLFLNSWLLLFILFSNVGHAQCEQFERDQFYEQEWENQKLAFQSRAQIQLRSDTAIDIKFYHLDVKIAIDSQYISGSVYIKFQPTENNLNTLKLNLKSFMIVDSVTMDAVSFSSLNDIVSVNLAHSFNIGNPVGIKIYYHGVPLLANATKGLRYSTHGNNEPVIASLSTPFLSHYWWPCKDGPSDKADSVYVDITIKDSIINGFALSAVSNGLLDAVDSSSGHWKTFKWKHRYPIVPYYVMAAISNYRTIHQTYTGTNSTFPLTYYVFDATYNQSVTGVSQMPAAFDRYIQLFGDYPFKKEKYGMTELGYYGAIENQTNTITNNMGTSWYYTSVHELAHQWFGDMITCTDWHHGWLNEGFASYSEALISEHLNGFGSYKTYMTSFEWYSGGSVYLPQDTDAFNIFQGIIYKKGAYVLHMLRGVLGDSLFFNSMKTYATSIPFKYRHATTDDFKQVCETVSGQNLQYFFDQWIYDQYYPRYKYNFYSHSSGASTAVTIYQQQGTVNNWRPVFKMPLQIRFQFSTGADTLITVMNDKQHQNYFFNFTDSVVSMAIDPDKWVLKTVIRDLTIDVAVNELSDQPGIVVYPNPATDMITVVAHANVSGSTYTLTDLLGKSVLTGKLATANSKISLNSLPVGMYLLKIGDQNKQTFKVLKQ
jgi:aminopeptidase N